MDANAAGILLADASGHLCVVGASSERVQLLELFQLQNEQGPCLDCYTSGEVVAAVDLNVASAWPKFAAESVAAGYLSVCAIPLHHKGATLGCLNLFMTSAGPLAPADIALAQALADVASIAIVQSHADRRTDDRNGQLHHALDSRIAVEQAKGMVAEQFTLDAHDAFEALRSNARANERSLTTTARQLVAGTLAIADFAPRPETPPTTELTTETWVEGTRRSVRIAGELDLATRLACFNACIDGDGDTVEIDISGITFMDCSGFSALVAAQFDLQKRHATLTVHNASGQPARLLACIEKATNLPKIRTPQPELLGTLNAPSPATQTHFKKVVLRSVLQRLTRLIRPKARHHTPAAPELTRRTPSVMQVQPTQIAKVKRDDARVQQGNRRHGPDAQSTCKR